MDRLGPWPFKKGKLGLCKGACLSTPNEELRRLRSSKWPDLFSLKVVEKANPESLRDTGVVGIGGNDVEMGDTDEGGLADLLVGGLSDFA